MLFRVLLSELHDAYFREPAHAQRVLAQLRFKQSAQTLVDVEEVCYLFTTRSFCLHACTCANVVQLIYAVAYYKCPYQWNTKCNYICMLVLLHSIGNKTIGESNTTVQG